MALRDCTPIGIPRPSDYYCSDITNYSVLNCLSMTCFKNPACTSANYVPGHRIGDCRPIGSNTVPSLYCICCTDPMGCTGGTTSTVQYTNDNNGYVMNLGSGSAGRGPQYAQSNNDDMGVQQMQSSSQFMADNLALSSTYSPTTGPDENNAFPPGAIAAIVVLSILLFLTILVVIFLLLRRVRDRRKNKGQYRPKEEEEKNLEKYPDLPYLTPPAIEGLI